MVTRETDRLSKDGRVIPVHSSQSPLRDSAGNVVGASIILQDITERIRLETELRQSQKMESVGRLAASVAHDFNNILTVILGNASLELCKEGLDSELSASLH